MKPWRKKDEKGVPCYSEGDEFEDELDARNGQVVGLDCEARGQGLLAQKRNVDSSVGLESALHLFEREALLHAFLSSILHIYVSYFVDILCIYTVQKLT